MQERDIQNEDSATPDYIDRSQAQWPSIEFQYRMYVGGITYGELERGAIYYGMTYGTYIDIQVMKVFNKNRVIRIAIKRTETRG